MDKSSKIWTSAPFYITCVGVSLLLLLSIWLEKYFLLSWVVFVILPIVDQILPLDHTNPTNEEEKMLEKESRW